MAPIEVEYGIFVYKTNKAVPLFSNPKAGNPTGQKLKDGLVISGGCLSNKMVQLEDLQGWVRLDSLQPLTLEYTGPKVYRVAVPSTSSGVPLKKYPDHDSSCSDERFKYNGLVTAYARVKGANGDWFVRLEGHCGWLAETWGQLRQLVPVDMGPEFSLDMYPELATNHYGLFVYEVMAEGGVGIRKAPSWGEGENFTGAIVERGKLISGRRRTVGVEGDVCVELGDGSGWVFEKKGKEKLLKPLLLEYGPFAYRVINPSTTTSTTNTKGLPTEAMKLLNRPDHDLTYMVTPEQAFTSCKVVCLARVVGAFGDWFVRLEHVKGWLYESKDGVQTLSPISPTSPYRILPDTSAEKQVSKRTLIGAALDLNQVRGVAITMGYQEVYSNQLACIASFERQNPQALLAQLPPGAPLPPGMDPESLNNPNSSGKNAIRVEVYYMTGTVCLTLLNPPEGSEPIRRFFRNVNLSQLTMMMQSGSLALFPGSPLDGRPTKRRKLTESSSSRRGGSGHHSKGHPPLPRSGAGAPPLPMMGGGPPPLPPGPESMMMGGVGFGGAPPPTTGTAAAVTRVTALDEEEAALAQHLGSINQKLASLADERRELTCQIQVIAAERRRRLLDELKLSRVREEQEKQRAEIEAKIRAEQAERERIRLMEEAMIRQQELAIQARAHEEAQAIQNAIFRRGDHFIFSLPNEPQSQGPLSKALSSIPMCAALGDKSYCCVYENGECVFFGLPKRLFDLICPRGPNRPPVAYMALGPEDQFYVQFQDGRVDWNGPDAFGNAVRGQMVKRVAFGIFGSWCVVLSTGQWIHSAAPSGLVAKFRQLGAGAPPVAEVSIGAGGEWFLALDDLSCSWGGPLSEALLKDLDNIQTQKGGFVRNILFNPHAGHLIRYAMPMPLYPGPMGPGMHAMGPGAYPPQPSPVHPPSMPPAPQQPSQMYYDYGHPGAPPPPAPPGVSGNGAPMQLGPFPNASSYTPPHHHPSGGGGGPGVIGRPAPGSQQSQGRGPPPPGGSGGPGPTPPSNTGLHPKLAAAYSSYR